MYGSSNSQASGSATVRPNRGIDILVTNLSGLDCARAQHAFLHVPGLLENADRSSVIGKRQCEDAQQIERRKGVVRCGAHRGRHDAPAPVRTPEPVPNLGGATLDVLPPAQADPTDWLIRNDNREVG